MISGCMISCYVYVAFVCEKYSTTSCCATFHNFHLPCQVLADPATAATESTGDTTNDTTNDTTIATDAEPTSTTINTTTPTAAAAAIHIANPTGVSWRREYLGEVGGCLLASRIHRVIDACRYKTSSIGWSYFARFDCDGLWLYRYTFLGW